MIFPSLEKTSLSAIYTVESILFIYIYFYLLKYAPLGINKTIWSDPLRLKSMMKLASQTSLMFMLINSVVGCLITVYSTNTCSSNFKPICPSWANLYNTLSTSCMSLVARIPFCLSTELREELR